MRHFAALVRKSGRERCGRKFLEGLTVAEQKEKIQGALRTKYGRGYVVDEWVDGDDSAPINFGNALQGAVRCRMRFNGCVIEIDPITQGRHRIKGWEESPRPTRSSRTVQDGARRVTANASAAQ